MLIKANLCHALKSNSDIADICSLHPCLLAPHANKPLHLAQHHLARSVIPSSFVLRVFAMALSRRQSASPIASVDYSRAQSYHTSRHYDFIRIILCVFSIESNACICIQWHTMTTQVYPTAQQAWTTTTRPCSGCRHLVARNRWLLKVRSRFVDICPVFKGFQASHTDIRIPHQQTPLLIHG